MAAPPPALTAILIGGPFPRLVGHYAPQALPAAGPPAQRLQAWTPPTGWPAATPPAVRDIGARLPQLARLTAARQGPQPPPPLWLH